jgi:hypothetical protein
MFVSTGVVVIGDVSDAAVSLRAADNGAGKRKRWGAEKGRGGQVWSCLCSMTKYLFIVLIGENASRRFSGATFQSRIDGCGRGHR